MIKMTSLNRFDQLFLAQVNELAPYTQFSLTYCDEYRRPTYVLYSREDDEIMFESRRQVFEKFFKFCLDNKGYINKNPIYQQIILSIFFTSYSLFVNNVMNMDIQIKKQYFITNWFIEFKKNFTFFKRSSNLLSENKESNENDMKQEIMEEEFKFIKKDHEELKRTNQFIKDENQSLKDELNSYKQSIKLLQEDIKQLKKQDEKHIMGFQVASRWFILLLLMSLFLYIRMMFF
jgi:hypothetical protein